jgi:hypothetical protein
MAIDREEQQRQQRELEEIRRSFAEMGARMGSLFEPASLDEDDEPSQAGPRAPERRSRLVPLDALPLSPEQPVKEQPVRKPVEEEPVPRPRTRWWVAAAVVLIFLAGSGFGYILSRAQDDGQNQPPPSSAATVTTRGPAVVPPPAAPGSVPEVCLQAVKAANQVIFYQNRNIRDRRLVDALQDYSRASQACNKEASP